MTGVPDEIGDLFESYARALDAFDREAVVEHLAVPCMLSSSSATVVCTSRADLEEGVDYLLERHREAGYHRGEHRVVAHRPMHPRFCSVDVAWIVRRLDESILWHFGVTYTLTVTDEGWKIAAATPNDKVAAN